LLAIAAASSWSNRMNEIYPNCKLGTKNVVQPYSVEMRLDVPKTTEQLLPAADNAVESRKTVVSTPPKMLLPRPFWKTPKGWTTRCARARKWATSRDNFALRWDGLCRPHPLRVTAPSCNQTMSLPFGFWWLPPLRGNYALDLASGDRVGEIDGHAIAPKFLRWRKRHG
jgi:hypothetical protein